MKKMLFLINLPLIVTVGATTFCAEKNSNNPQNTRSQIESYKRDLKTLADISSGQTNHTKTEILQYTQKGNTNKLNIEQLTPQDLREISGEVMAVKVNTGLIELKENQVGRDLVSYITPSSILGFGITAGAYALSLYTKYKAKYKIESLSPFDYAVLACTASSLIATPMLGALFFTPKIGVLYEKDKIARVTNFAYGATKLLGSYLAGATIASFIGDGKHLIAAGPALISATYLAYGGAVYLNEKRKLTQRAQICDVIHNTPSSNIKDGIQKSWLHYLQDALYAKISHAEECSICWDDEFTEEDNLAITNCGHYFHKECILKWRVTAHSQKFSDGSLEIYNHHQCPNCRKPILYIQIEQEMFLFSTLIAN